MKTSELRNWLIKSGFAFEEYEKTIVINGLLTIYKEEQALEIYDESWQKGIGLELLNKAIEYINTPVSEREEEKKYRIELAEICEGVLSREGMSTKIYSMSSIVKSSNETKIMFNNIFTQSEIDNFPKEIKGAIECGFLRKVEVEQC